MKRANTLDEFLNDADTSCPRQITARRAVDQILDSFGRTGGASFSLYFGDLTGQPFYAVSVSPGRTKLALSAELLATVLFKFISDNSDLLADPRNCIGLWHDVDADVIFIEVSTVIQDRELAEALGATYNQIEIYDLHARRTIPTGGTGEELERWPLEQDRLPPLRRG